MKSYHLFVLIFWPILFLHAEIIPEMVTDRPDQTESSVTVPSGWLQIETGSIIEEDSPENLELTNFTYNTTLFRYGILEDVEIRLGGNFLQEKISMNNGSIKTTGLSPISIGFKTRLLKENKALPELAFLGHLSLPYLANEDLANEYIAPDFRIAGTKTLSQDISMGFNFGGEWDGDTPRPHFFYSYVLGAGFGDKIGLFAEIYGYINEKAKPDHRFDTGITFLVNPAFQLDFSAGLGINAIAPDYFISGGLSYRFEIL